MTDVNAEVGGAVKVNAEVHGVNVNASLGGAVDYNTKVINKPKINNVTLVGNKTADELGLADYEKVGVLRDTGNNPYPILRMVMQDFDDNSGVIVSYGDEENPETLFIPDGAEVSREISEVASEIPTELSQLNNDANYVQDANYVHTDNNFTTALKTLLEGMNPVVLIAIPFDSQGEWTDDDHVAYYKLTSEEYVDPRTLTVSHYYSPQELCDISRLTLYVTRVSFIVFGIIFSDILRYEAGLTSDSAEMYVPYSSLHYYTDAYVFTSSVYGKGYIKWALKENGAELPEVKGYVEKYDISNFNNDMNYVQDASYVHTDNNYTDTDEAKVANLGNWASSPTVGGNAKQSNGILWGQIDDTSTSTAFTATVPSLNELYDGACVYLTNGVVTSASGWTLNVNGLGAKPVYQTMALATRVTTLFNINYTMMFIYNSHRVADGCWDMYYGYNSDTNTTAYQVRSNGSGYKAQAKFYRYRLLFEAMDGVHVVPANTSSSTNATTNRTPNTAPFNPWGRIFYYSTTTAIDAEVLITGSYLWERYAGITLGYSFAQGSALNMDNPKAVYLKCTPQADNSVVLDSSTPYVQDLPSTEDGKVYIYLGQATSATAIELAENHPVYEYKSGKIRLFVGN